MKRIRHHIERVKPRIGIDWAQPSTWRGAVLLATIGLAVLFGLLGHEDLAKEVFIGGVAAVGAIGLGIKD